jgi:hypothetical protein
MKSIVGAVAVAVRETVRDIHRRTPVSQGSQSSEVMALAERCRAIR